MMWETTRRNQTGRNRRIWSVWIVALGLALVPDGAAAQYFGQNKVQYESFDFRVLRTDHFEVHYYPEEAEAARDAARMAERWYARLSKLFGHEFNGRRPIILYADHPDFQQTNVVEGSIGESTGGVTTALRERVVLPLTGLDGETDHVLGHEIVHVFQYDIAQAPNGGGLSGMSRLPLWFVEGLAEYLSLGREDAQTAMWLRDAVLRDDIPTLDKLSRDSRYFPYRFGHAVWAYIGGRWGDEVIGPLYRSALRRGLEGGILETLGLSADSLSKEWAAALRETYGTVVSERTPPAEAGRRVIGGEGPGRMNLAPALSPDGRYVAYYSERGLFTIDLWLADAETGKVLRRLASPSTDPHFDALSFTHSAGSWSPDGTRFVYVVFAQGRNELAIADVATGKVLRRLAVPGVGAITSPAWSPDGRRIAFSGMSGGISDLYVVDVEDGSVRALTRDREAQLQPAWSPDGRTLAYVTDDVPGTDRRWLDFAPTGLALLDVETGEVRRPRQFEGARHTSPQFSPDGRSLYFVAVRDGTPDVYRLDLQTDAVHQVTRLATGVSGISGMSTPLSVASRSGRLAYVAFEERGYAIYALEPGAALGTRVEPVAGLGAVGGMLPPVEPSEESLVDSYLADAATGLQPAEEFTDSRYRPSLRLDYIGPPTVGVAVDRSSTMLGGSAAFYFGDLLGNRQLAVGVQAQGTLKDVGGQVIYTNRAHRWNWLVGAGRVPYLTGATYIRDTTVVVGGAPTRGRVVGTYRDRIYLDQALVTAQYPFSTTRRLEVSGGYTRYGFDREIERVLFVGGREADRTVESLEAPDGFGLVQTAFALVGDNSYFGFTSPVTGQRFRFELSPRFGSLNFHTVLADYRRYFFRNPFTLAVRGLHYGRYGRDGESPRLTSLYLGEPTLVRGYGLGSFDPTECTRVEDEAGRCVEFDRLVGTRMSVANVELRVPLLGTSEFGLLNVPFLPTELAAFVDAGAAWTADESPSLTLARRSLDRIPVFSAGLSARINLLGYAVAEIYYAYPFQRPEKGGHFGFSLAPGW